MFLNFPKLRQEAFNRIEAVMPKVSYHVNAERLAQLPHHSKPKNIQAEVQRFAEDWSEIRPEWGLGSKCFLYHRST